MNTDVIYSVCVCVYLSLILGERILHPRSSQEPTSTATNIRCSFTGWLFGGCWDSSRQQILFKGVRESSCDDGHMDFSLVLIINNCSKDDIGRRVCQRCDHLGDSVDLGQCEVFSSGDVVYNSCSPLDRSFDQRSRCGRDGCLFCAILSAGDSDTQHGCTRVAHDGLHICEINVDQSRNGNDVRNTLHSLSQDIIGEQEGILERRRLSNNIQQAVIWNHNQCVHILPQRFNSICCLVSSASTFKCEWERDHSYCQDTHIL
mmetsp:Transcript_1984/g.4083  ORF Transcript_1984/g.4083 Transcript_1984/m.4083 type:complete len:260 (+) Transcript_1984:1123-1902(+)